MVDFFLRWAQTQNYGVIPNPSFVNGFMAQGFDLGDPWNGNIKALNYCALPSPRTLVLTKCSFFFDTIKKIIADIFRTKMLLFFLSL